VLVNVGLVAALGYAYTEGDFERMLHGYDFRGELCGVGELSGEEYKYWPEPDVSLDLSLCLPGCPSNTAVQGICLYDTDHTTETDSCYTTYPSKPFAKMCIPASTDLREDITERIFQDVEFVGLRVVADVFRAWDVILIGVAISFALALLFLIFFRFPGTMLYVIAACCVLTVFLFGVCSYLLWEESQRVYDLINDDYKNVEMEDSDDNLDSWWYYYLAITVAIVGGLVLLVIIVLALSVKRTFEILRLSARPLKNVPLLLLIPFV
jgi:hypothetical protein